MIIRHDILYDGTVTTTRKKLVSVNISENYNTKIIIYNNTQTPIYVDMVLRCGPKDNENGYLWKSAVEITTSEMFDIPQIGFVDIYAYTSTGESSCKITYYAQEY